MKFAALMASKSLLDLCIMSIANYCTKQSLGYRYDTIEIDVTTDEQKLNRIVINEENYPDPSRYLSCITNLYPFMPEHLLEQVINQMPVKGQIVKCSECHVNCPRQLCKIEIAFGEMHMLVLYSNKDKQHANGRILCNGCVTCRWRNNDHF